VLKLDKEAHNGDKYVFGDGRQWVRQVFWVFYPEEV